MHLLAIDPGETTGWSRWDGDKLIDAGQTALWEFIDWLSAGFSEHGVVNHTPLQLDTIDQIVCEDWALYPKEMRSGALDWDKCRTARGIGAIELICRISGTPIELQPAKIKADAVAAGAEEFFFRPLHENRHQNDSIMHAVYFNARRRPVGKVVQRG